MPVPNGVISTSEGPVDPSKSTLEEAIIEADAEEAVEEYVPELEEVALPEAEADDL